MLHTLTMGECSTQREAKLSSSWVAIKAQHSTARVSRGRGVWHLQSLQIFFIHSSTVRQNIVKMKLNFLVWLIFSITPTSFAFEIVCLPCLIGVKALLVKCNLFKKSTYNSYISSPQLGESIILTSLLASRGQLPKIPGLDLPGLPGLPGLAGEDLLPASSLPGLDLDLDPTGLTNVANFPQLPRSAYKRSSRFAFLLLRHAKSINFGTNNFFASEKLAANQKCLILA